MPVLGQPPCFPRILQSSQAAKVLAEGGGSDWQCADSGDILPREQQQQQEWQSAERSFDALVLEGRRACAAAQVPASELAVIGA